MFFYLRASAVFLDRVIIAGPDDAGIAVVVTVAVVMTVVRVRPRR